MAAPTKQRFADRVLEQFEPEVADALVEFSKYLAHVEADALIFMVLERRSVCTTSSNRWGRLRSRRSSSRIGFDTDLAHLAGRRVALVDDTLMVGTTLAETTRRLQELPGVEVSSHVFCRNVDYALPELHQPDTTWLDMDEQRIRMFCSAEVRAFSVAPQPYLSDFPAFKGLRLIDEDLPLLLSSIDWHASDLTSGLQERHDVRVYTLFPSTTVIDQMRSVIGDGVMDLIEIVKVRAFAARRADLWWLQLVPTVTLKPLREADVPGLLRALLDRLETLAACELDVLSSHAHTPAAGQRLVQYLLGCMLGGSFVADVRTWAEGVDRRDHLDHGEADRHWGPWMHEQVSAAARAACLLGEAPQGGPTIAAPRPAALPAKALELAAARLTPLGDGNSQPPVLAERLATDFAEIFLHLYRDEELPARQEARELGRQILGADEHQAPHRDRLKYGVPWAPIVKEFTERYELEPSSDTLNMLSLVLDVCNDRGDCRAGYLGARWGRVPRLSARRGSPVRGRGAWARLHGRRDRTLASDRSRRRPAAAAGEAARAAPARRRGAQLASSVPRARRGDEPHVRRIQPPRSGTEDPHRAGNLGRSRRVAQHVSGRAWGPLRRVGPSLPAGHGARLQLCLAASGRRGLRARKPCGTAAAGPAHRPCGCSARHAELDDPRQLPSTAFRTDGSRSRALHLRQVVAPYREPRGRQRLRRARACSAAAQIAACRCGNGGALGAHEVPRLQTWGARQDRQSMRGVSGGARGSGRCTHVEQLLGDDAGASTAARARTRRAAAR